MPLSALFLLMMGAGGFLVYSAVKDQHPWELFTTTLSGKNAAGVGGGTAAQSAANQAQVAPLGSGAGDVTDPTRTVGSGNKAA
jgi:hypothetical protein